MAAAALKLDEDFFTLGVRLPYWLALIAASYVGSYALLAWIAQ